MKRGHNNNQTQFPRPYFYAPLTTDKVPTICYNNDYSIYYAGSTAILNGALYVASSASSQATVWGCDVPSINAFTINCYLKDSTKTQWGRRMALYDPSCPRYSGFCLGSYSNGQDCIPADWLIFPFNGSYIPSNQWNFVSITAIKNGTNYVIKLYVDGLMKQQLSFTNTLWRFILNCKFATGFTVSSDNQAGYQKHYSFYDELTDEQILQLYNNGGVPL